MSGPRSRDDVLQIGDWLVQPALGRVSRGDEQRRLRPQLMDLLLLLASEAGAVVAKDRLLDEIWARESVAESALTSSIAELRQLLGDSAQAPRYIETIPKRGYRMVAVVAAAGTVSAPRPGAAPAAGGLTPTALGERPGATAAGPPARGISPGLAALMAALGLGVGVLAGITLVSPRPAAAPVIRLAIPLVLDSRIDAAEGPRMAISPDGWRLVYASRADDDAPLVVRRIDDFDERPLAGTNGARAPFFSPDGRWVGFVAGGRLQKVPVDGGAPQPLADARAAFGPSWSSERGIVFAPTLRSGLVQVPAGGGASRPVTTLRENEVSHRCPDVLPGGRAVLYTVLSAGRPAEIVAQSFDTGSRRTIVEPGLCGRYVEGGHLVYLRGDALVAVPFDAARLEVTGPAETIAEHVLVLPASALPGVVVARTGTVAFLPPDGRFVMVQAVETPAEAPRIDVVLNWFAARR